MDTVLIFISLLVLLSLLLVAPIISFIFIYIIIGPFSFSADSIVPIKFTLINCRSQVVTRNGFSMTDLQDLFVCERESVCVLICVFVGVC